MLTQTQRVNASLAPVLGSHQMPTCVPALRKLQAVGETTQIDAEMPQDSRQAVCYTGGAQESRLPRHDPYSSHRPSTLVALG